MSRIKDLEIRGIRNFGDESSKVRIRFTKPLTLILGPNGTGKTTIIESLKFVTSGEYPPDSDRGKSFVHEPKAMSHSVRGQIKAKILDKKGQELVITRTMQVTRQKNQTLKLQALDNTITRLEKNEKVQISSRCADIDREMLIAMGVSKPILNYVIFCHQEESNWPLEDGKKLKERFDEIFDTSKYNKALDATTKLIKDLGVEASKIKAKEEALKVIVDEVTSKENKLKNEQMREQEGREKINAIQEAVIPINERLQKILDIKCDYDHLQEKIKVTETEYSVANTFIESLEQHIKTIHEGTKEDLIDRLETYEINLTQKQTKQRKLEDNLKLVEKEEENLSKKLADKRIQLGSLTQKKIAFDEKIEKRNQLLLKALKTWEIPQNDPELLEEDIQGYVNQIKNKYKDFVSTMKTKIESNKQEEKFLQEDVDVARTEKTEIGSEINLKEKEKNKIKSEIHELRTKIKEAGEASVKLNSIESNLQNASENYEALVKDFKEDTLKNNLKMELKKKVDYNSKLNVLDQEINSLHQLSSQQAELEINQNNLKEKAKHILILTDKHKKDLGTLFNGNVPENKFKENLEKIQKLLIVEKNNLMKRIESERKKITTLEANLKYKQHELSTSKSELEDKEEKVFAVCEGKEYNETLLLQERKVKSLQDQVGIYANQSAMYKEYLKLLKKKSCCPLCERKFQDSSEENQLEQKLYKEIKNSPEALKECEKELKIENSRYNALQQLKSDTEKITQLKKKIPDQENAIDKLKTDIQAANEELDNLSLTLAEPESKMDTYRTLIGDMSLLDRYIDEKDKLNSMIEVMKSKMLKAGKIGDRSMQEAQDEREIIKIEIADIENNIAKLQSDLQAGQEKVQKAREQKNKLNEEVLQIRQFMQEEKQMKDKLNELFAKTSSLDTDLKSLKSKLVGADDDLTAKERELDELKKKNQEIQDKEMDFKSTSVTEIRELENVQMDVRSFISNKIEENLKKVEEDVEKIKKELEEKKLEIQTLGEKIRFLDEQCKSQAMGKEDLKNNLDLINKKENLKEITKKLSGFRKILKDMQFDQLMEEYRNLERKKAKYEKEKNEITGAQNELENSIKTAKRELNQEHYRMARLNYKTKMIEYVVHNETISNLKEYARVLDKAMIQFHEERMNTVNKIMHQLWSLVYGGNDTSSIQIRVQTTEGIGDKRRSYNYKLVQVKRSSEMDMKGRCSAGQKVLASIIIRMALAETFCSECAVLALDEPTTNLDIENATNLAITLSKVIQLRAQHRQNFQLIVISHDEKFISHLSNLSGRQLYQELYRNQEGYSLIRRRDFSNYVEDNTQDPDRSEDESDEEEEEIERKADCSSKIKRKRNLSLDDSPPHSSKKRACYK